MKNVKVYINSSTQTTEQKWGVSFTDSSVTALMTPAPKKEYIKNKSPLKHGTQVLTSNSAIPKTDERTVQLTFFLKAPTLAQFIMRYRAFVNELEKGTMNLTIYVWENNTYFKETYHLLYLSCNQFSEFNGKLAKFVLKLSEPNPKNRTFEHSTDITINENTQS
ncbi:MAG: hypothetical protein II278_03755 [Bacteroidaceae bacterium]|nr:hypothetical protein [Bacteroidaceae bacterium]